ncbi:hypothetical protein PsorP6_009653 [Peronosclerospora sorghi]|uniref:Uncharacterized protein n=1 Tax=Peronosclerospora sorghi TaxID=230839 RepID=A0ACC0W130_9STRA|nr:hypothetical protein PsorP6_009653 [Peronosclerospora sorghi]
MTLDGFIKGSRKRRRATEVDCLTHKSLKTRIIEFFADADVAWAVVERKTFKYLLPLCNPKTSTMLIKHQAINVIVDKPYGVDVDIGTVYGRIKNLSKHVGASPQRRKELSCAVTLRQPGSTVYSMLSDVTTRWNSTYLMFRGALQLN